MKSKKKQRKEQQEKIMIAVIALILGLGFGFGIGALADSEANKLVTMESSEMASHSHSDTYDVKAEDAPTVDFIVEEDTKSGWNIKIITSKFRFAPENVNKENVPGEGHAHLYVDGEKVARVYGEYYHYPEEFDGTKTFEVELNANDHSVYTVDGEKINATIQVSHNHSEIPHADDEDMEGHSPANKQN